MFVDSHCHLDKINPEKAGADLTQIVEMARANKVEHMLCVCVTLEDFPAMQQAVADFNDVSISCGVHPLYVKDSQTPIVELGTKLRQLASANNVVAIGETGLDYFYHPESKALQRENFEQHIEIAKDINKPLIIHTRDAQDDTLSLLKNGHADKSGGVLHCFTESLDMAKKAIDDLDFYISISGIASFRNAEQLRATIKALPLEKLLIETDSPWLAPVPHRGKENQPAYVIDVAKCVADVKGITLEEVAKTTTANYYKLFNNA
ncbi:MULTISPECIES: YchF/TatD family DNA exonuclease [Idiomarina]|jgi:TatD DNase family protein|uniref:YchF/TatD family DNA exonuclease n=1 Tax=Idiomarina abyssalis TaxID=86102 RepID=A0A8I1KHN3_9GAMM|nr:MULTISPECIES: YchF/TatD family DNA exonuclease [Idiomarina]MAO67247.1 metal-dependent hydrolase [Idiomarina sp.]MBF80045.1 metal-dependent hydrolase [Idiomarina sp.]MBJ7267972.1 YchF/TatD family DNA exonuclease [Idiomarina abyssalis]MBJ7272447.1 YchF/TatD family DNA exonuclease [Idiomarina abyssalis]MBJ7316983.1 YchF/TatD family DNA exonuclease [Idiomarina abyssalis]|tara:strand:- start:631 stop:1419 length:789 start_codon:yes stop_codon:yes gene_type:complete